MKKKTLRAVMAAFLMAAMPAFAASYAVTADQAKAMVAAWSVENKGGFGLDGAAVTGGAPFSDASGRVLGYAVTLADGRCVFTSADTRIEPVIAVVSDCAGELPAAHPLRALLEADLSSRLAAVSQKSGTSLQSVSPTVSPTASKVSASIRAARAKWTRYTGGASLMAVNPSIATPNGNPPLTYAYLPGFSNANGSHLYLTHWNQSYEKTGYMYADGQWNAVQVPVYNYYTPHNYVCGCVATAGAAVLQYYNVTNGPVAVTNTCTVNGESVELATLDGAYDWSILPENMGGRAPNVDNLNEAQRELLGRVTYNMGVCVGMGYDNNGTGSGANGTAPADAFTNYFGFATAVAYGEGAFDKAIYNHLRCDSPVILSINKKGSMSGHEVVAVGYGRDAAGNSYTRVFMGWGGASDAWYQLPDITSDYNVVNGTVAMLSLDGACVPFVGQVWTANGQGAAGVEVSIPGVTNVLTGANGLFAFRLTEEVAKTVTEVTVTAGGFTTNVEVTVGEDLSAAESLPDEVVVVLPETATCVPSCLSPADAVSRAVHSDPQRLICMLSGRDGDPGTETLKAWLAANAEDFNGKYVFYFADIDTDGHYLQDGMPSVGVFNPLVFDPAGGWSAGNGRMAYLNAATDDVGEEAVKAMLDAAADKWTRILDGTVVSISAGNWVTAPSSGDGGLVIVDPEEGSAGPEMTWVPVEVEKGFSKDYDVGVYTDAFVNGDEVTLTCAAEYTNAVAGVLYRCAGWELYDAETGDLVDSGDANEATFAVGLPDLDFRWILEEAAYHVQVTVQIHGNGRLPTDPTVLAQLVTPVDAWVAPGETLDLVAAPATQGSYTWVHYGWSSLEKTDDDVLEGRVATIVATSPRSVFCAVEQKGTTGVPAAESGTVTVGIVPAELADQAPETRFGGMTVAYGSPTAISVGKVVLAPAATNFVDATGTNWVLSGWQDGVGSGTDARVAFDLEKDDAVSFNWVWVPAGQADVVTSYAIEWTNSLDNLSATYETNLISTADLAAAGMTLTDLTVTAPKGFKVMLTESTGEVVAKLSLDEEVLRPAPGSALTIESQGDGTVVVRGLVVNGVAGFWYSLYSADDLAGSWQLVASGEYTEGAPAEQAQTDDTTVEVSITVQPDAARKFYKLRVTDVNPETIN